MKQNIELLRHSLAHIMASTVLKLYPKAKFGVGPNIDNGFYYDIEIPSSISENDLQKIEDEMKKIIASDLEFEKSELRLKDAIKLFTKLKQDYKVELLKDLEKHGTTKISDEESFGSVDSVSIYKTGEFVDLCRGPHVTKTSELKNIAFKLNKIAGAYWRGNEKNKMLTRIYGLAFENKEELGEYLKTIEEAEKRDHRKLGKELDLFSFHSEAPGFVFWHEKGMILWNELESFGKTIRKKYGSIEIKTPQMAKNSLWITSGHWDHYKEEMFSFDVEGETYCLKPMDCPFNIKIYQSRPRSYKDLPIRYTEIGRVFRNEKSGQLNGLFRVREITQDDSHVFCREDQVKNEIINLLNMTDDFYSVLGIKPKFFLSTRPDNFMGEISTWDKAEKDLKNALKEKNISYELKEKDGAFYGPKIDVNIEDVFKRSWQVATIQLDFQLPQRFNCEYIDKDGNKKILVMLHAAIFGSFERMTGILIEHYGGAFPLWLSPTQIKLISVGESHIEHCEKLANEFKEHGIRVEIDDTSETVGNKIRKSASEKIPYVLVIGDKEINSLQAKKSNSAKLSVRIRGQKDLVEIEKDKFIGDVLDKINKKSLEI